MYGNGAVIGMEATVMEPKQIQKDYLQALFESSVAVVGTLDWDVVMF